MLEQVLILIALVIIVFTMASINRNIVLAKNDASELSDALKQILSIVEERNDIYKKIISGLSENVSDISQKLESLSEIEKRVSEIRNITMSIHTNTLPE